MAYTKISNSKASPTKGIAYILEEEKVEVWTTVNMCCDDSNSAKDLGQEMIETQRLHGKCKKYDDRKYYHTKVSFDEKDRTEQGGKLSPQMALEYGEKLALKLFPGHESVVSVHGNGRCRHIHIITNAVSFEDGKKIDLSKKDYGKCKDAAQELCHEFGLIAGDWRQAQKKKNDQERQPDEAIVCSFTEQRLVEEGQRSWKMELRNIIDEAAETARSMDEFKRILEANNVTLSRLSDNVISYKYGDHKACRGDKLGGDYTRQAINSAIENNKYDRQDAVKETKKRGLDDQIAAAERGRPDRNVRSISRAERQNYRAAGRYCNIPRSKIDNACNAAPKKTNEEKQKAWERFKSENKKFRDAYNKRIQEINEQIREEYWELKRVRQAEWELNIRNKKRNLISAIEAAIFLSRTDSSEVIRGHIEELKATEQDLREVYRAYKKKSDEAYYHLCHGYYIEDCDAALENLEDCVATIAVDSGVIRVERDWTLQQQYDVIREAREKKTKYEEYENEVK